ncbi:glutathione S-transferase [Pseudomonas sp. RIT-PI-S]|uniref:glutathione S-transferase family protein n=1 Tax=Pseudomonas sp. RIT-PI-S TaxID=3035295 RepID=UPI0021D9960F|nr:glutathione S-transferase [Pseudomonas sp. RIT-PI-S]
MYTLFGTKRSGSAAIEIALKRCGIEYHLTSASSWLEGNGSEQLKRLNPLMQVPTLQLPDGSVMSESAAILTYLGLEFPGAALLAQAPAERAQQLRALVYIAANCYAAIGVTDYPERWLPNAEEDTLKQLADGAEARLHEYWDTFSDVFAKTAAWHPEQPGAPEILACVVTQWSGTREHLKTSRPAFYQALLHIDRHPVVEPVLQSHWPVA